MTAQTVGQPQANGGPRRVLTSKLGLDGHDRGAKVVAMMLRDAGFEVIYAGLRQTPETITRIAIDEDVDLVGISILSGAHGLLVPKVLDELRAAGSEAPVVVGGIVPSDDQTRLRRAGVAAVFGPGESSGTIIETITNVLGDADN
jgi:methylmalonyl-CoA mutase C-terminal domain/subunit